MIYNPVNTATLSKYGRYQLHSSYCVMTVCNNDATDTNDTVEGRHLVGNVNTVRSTVAGPGAHIRSVRAQQCGNGGTRPPMLT